MKIKEIILKVFITVVVLSAAQDSYSQTTQVAVVDSTGQVAKKIKFGCGFGLSFVGGTNVSLAPNLTYLVSDKISVGAGIQGSYTAIKDVQSTTTVGGNIIGQYTPIKILTTLLEFAELNVSTEITESETETTKDNYWDTALFVGAGINVTEKISVGAKYNLLYDEDQSVYTSPVLPFVNITF